MISRPSGLVAFDLDGTLLRGPTVCELISEPLGRLEDMRRFERSTTDEAVTAARIEMASWYRGIPLSKLVEPLQSARWAPGAHEGVASLQRAGLEVALVSVTWSFAVGWFAERLGVGMWLGTDLGLDGTVGHVWPRDKGCWLSALVAELRIPSDRVAAVGDSAGDVDLLNAASLPIFVGPAASAPPPRALHMPEASIARVAAHVLATWAG